MMSWTGKIDSRWGSGIQVVNSKGKDEVFMNELEYFFTAQYWHQSGIDAVGKYFVHDKILSVQKVHRTKTSANGNLVSSDVANFLEKEWQSFRVLP